MKKINYILLMLILFFCTLTVNATAEEKGPFFFDWENTKVEDAYYEQPLLSDNFAFKDGSVIIRTIEKEGTIYSNIEIERRNIKGEVVATNKIEEAVFFSGIADSNNIYIVIIKENTKGEPSSDQYVLKLDENLEVVATLPFEAEYTPGVDGMVNARIFGHDILAVKDNYLYVFCGEEYMLRATLELKEWETMEYSKTKFAKYFPDLSTEYDLMNEWMNALYNGGAINYLDIEVTTHVYDEKTISSGMRFFNTNSSEIPFAGVIKITDNSGKVIFEEINNNYMKFIEARIIGDYVVAIGLTESSVMGNSSATELGNDIVIYNMDGDNVQTIETEGSYLFLNEINSGFVATHVESCAYKETDLGSISIEGMTGIEANMGDSAGTRICTYNTEAYYLPLEIETKVEGKGTVEAIHNSRKGEVVTFKVTPEEGYVLSVVKVTDANGNIVTFTDYTFTMPSANVLIEAVFVEDVKNSETADIAIITVVGLLIVAEIVFLITNKQKKWLK